MPIVLVVDQFEETYTLSPLDEGMLFEQCLLTLAGVPNFHLILTVRADFYPNLMRSPLWNLIQAHRMEVTALSRKALREAIAAPAKQAGVSIEDALVERLLADAAGEPGALPFLQETLVLLWEKVKARKLALSAYIDLAGDNDTRTGLQVAMARSADQALLDKRMPAAGAITTRRVFMRLIQFGEGRPDTRRQQTEADLHSVGDDPAIFGAVLALLIDRRLLTTDRDHANPQRKIDIAQNR
ncbi:MAG: hypothetical protein IPK16_20670 [Anaerolineales bacterium]|nr:hypothetical protein [Anaerolineales bacterium]